MKKYYVLPVMVAMTVVLAACAGKPVANEVSGETVQAEEAVAVVEETKEAEEVPQVSKEQSAVQAGSLEELEEKVASDVEESIAALQEEYTALVTDIDSYEKYLESVEIVEGFYAKVLSETQSIFTRLQEYCVEYANLILASDKEHDEKYDDFDEMYDCVYEDACDEVYDEVYEGILDDIYDAFYDGILDDAKDDADYGEWLDARSNEYELWLDTRSDVYEEWLDSRSDIYEFWLDIRGEMWDDDMEKAQEVVEDFKEDIEKRKQDVEIDSEDENDASDEDEVVREETGADEVVEEEAKAEAKAGSDDGAEADLVDGMRPEFKEAMDSYEEFYEEYCEVLKQYMEDPTDLAVLTEYSDLMQQSIDVAEKFEEWDNGDLNTEELKYYVEVNGRVTQMLVEASGQ